MVRICIYGKFAPNKVSRLKSKSHLISSSRENRKLFICLKRFETNIFPVCSGHETDFETIFRDIFETNIHHESKVYMLRKTKIERCKKVTRQRHETREESIREGRKGVRSTSKEENVFPILWGNFYRIKKHLIGVYNCYRVKIHGKFMRFPITILSFL